MKDSRANFAFTVVDNILYVFGGIGGQGPTPETAHEPQMVNNLCEKYDPKTNVWETIEIKNAFPVGAFGWTVLDSPERVMVFGGSDGDYLQRNSWIIDFKKQVAQIQNNEINEGSDDNIVMSQMYYRKKTNTVHCLGGFNSRG